MLYSQAWLENQNSVRIILVEATVLDVLAGTEKVLYLSNAGYITTDSSVSYLPFINNDVVLNESISADGGVSMSFGDLELTNTKGEWDVYLDNTKYVWANRSIKIYLGDASWVSDTQSDIYSNFALIFNGTIADVDCRTNTTINIKMRDKLQLLNTPLTENKLGTYGTWNGGQQNLDSIRPLVFGEVFNYSPMLVDPSTLEYMYNDGAAEAVTEVRDEGVPLYTVGQALTGVTLSGPGKFKLTSPSSGRVTMSVQGINNSINLTDGTLQTGTYANSLAHVIALISTQYGKSSTRLNAITELDLPTFLPYSTIPIGYVVSDRENVLAVCQKIANSVGVQVFMSRVGKLQLLRYGTPTSEPSVDITPADMLLDSLAISNRLPIGAAVKLGYCKNWTVQPNILTSIPQQHKDLFANEWLSETRINTTVRTRYKLDTDPVQKDTMLISGDSVLSNELDRLLALTSTQKTVYKFTGTAKLLSLKMGQPVTLYHNRFGLSAGVTGQVVSLRPNWTSATIEVEVLI